MPVKDIPVPAVTLLETTDFCNTARRHCGCFSDMAPDTNVATQLNSTQQFIHPYQFCKTSPITSAKGSR